MLYVALAAFLLLMGTAGYIVYLNSRLIGEKKYRSEPVQAASYTVYMTRSFTGEDARNLAPVAVMEYREGGASMQVCLCRIHSGEPELKLSEAADVFKRHLEASLKNGSFLSFRTEPGSLRDEEEQRVTERLSAASRGKEMHG
ncbi:hypothetical protein [Paenibacillus campinasensis]|uniref:Uncharacterized protein n=1 Tax=Paenibacillus campinasensis TaxID=66347 RepID=A0A268ERK4_9BACL|nr:hypothetical protein [Paenibacillus campinasensis]MUG66248.1 hypothetical protein [Paenibacillus campinasensis]PAD75753.1 hypothetical protein CHH67_14000 [Paenibacillus campinasensis]